MDDTNILSQTSNCSTHSLHKPCMGQFHDKFGWIADRVPCFGVDGNKISVFTEPSQFYDSLKDQILNAKSRIVLASLYLGTGKLEEELVDCIRKSCAKAEKEGNKDFEVHILFDHVRGSRGGDKSSRTMLLPLLMEFGDRVHVHLYHTPDLRGLLKRYLPEKYNEGIGLTHMKIYLTDDTFIISGANLNNDYFTNRQDRYISFTGCTDLANYLTRLVKTVSSFSFKLNKDNTTCLPDGWNIHPFEDHDNGARFKAAATSKVKDMLNSKHGKFDGNHDNSPQQSSAASQSSEESYHSTKESMDSGSDTDMTQSSLSHVNSGEIEGQSVVDTWVCPLIQMGMFGIDDDEQVTSHLLHHANSDDQIYLTSGYFNLTDQYMNVILRESCAIYKILMAAPEVNGFYGAKGLIGKVPEVYVHVAHQFHQHMCSRGQQHRISMFEYFRDKWTYHAKGLWYYLPHEELPVLTLVGSPNFGYRSIYRDLECQMALVTENKSLQKQLKEEHERLYQLSSPVTEETFHRQDRRASLFVRMITGFIKHYF